jgi:hypothetical protein
MERLNLAWDIKRPEDLPVRPELVPIIEQASPAQSMQQLQHL